MNDSWKIDELNREIAELRKYNARLYAMARPHVISIEELECALDTVVWIEVIGGQENTSDWYALVDSYSRKYGKFYFRFITSYDSVDEYSYDLYGKSWRVWNRRPHDAQRKEYGWNEQ